MELLYFKLLSNKVLQNFKLQFADLEWLQAVWISSKEVPASPKWTQSVYTSGSQGIA